MPNWRRNRVLGGTFFFTVTLRDRRSRLLVDGIDLLRETVRAVRRQFTFHIDGWGILPDHMHCLWTLPTGDSDFPKRWRHIKTGFSRAVAGQSATPTNEPHPPYNGRDNDDIGPTTIRRAAVAPRIPAVAQAGMWQRGYWEHTIRADRDYTAHMDYIHFNPVKHGLVSHADEWPYSSFHRCVAIGIYAPDDLKPTDS